MFVRPNERITGHSPAAFTISQENKEMSLRRNNSEELSLGANSDADWTPRQIQHCRARISGRTDI